MLVKQQVALKCYKALPALSRSPRQEWGKQLAFNISKSALKIL